MGNNHRSQGGPRIQPPNNVAAQMTITAFTDGSPVGIQCTTTPLNSLRLLAMAIQAAANALEPQVQEVPADKERKFLGPRKP